MTDQELDRLFEAARNVPVETTLQRVTDWVGAAAARRVADTGSLTGKSITITKKTWIMMGGTLAGLGTAGLLAFWLFYGSGPEAGPTENKAPRPQASVAEKGIASSGIERSGLLAQDMPWKGFSSDPGKGMPAGANAVESKIDGSAMSGMEDGEEGGCDEGPSETTAPGNCGTGEPVSSGPDGSAARTVLTLHKDLVRERREVGEFDGIVLRGVMDLTIRQGDQREVIVEATAEQQERTEVSTKGKILVLDTEGKKRHAKGKVPKEPKVKVWVTVTDLNTIEHLGVGDLLTEGALDQDALKIDFSGVGDMDLHLRCDDLQVEFSGVGDTKLQGKAGRADLDYSGVGDLHALDFPVQKLDISASGIGKADIHATDELTVKFSGVGNVTYTGEPAKKSIQASGVGKVRKR